MIWDIRNFRVGGLIKSTFNHIGFHDNNVTRTVDDLKCCAQFTTRFLGIYSRLEAGVIL